MTYLSRLVSVWVVGVAVIGAAMPADRRRASKVVPPRRAACRPVRPHQAVEPDGVRHLCSRVRWGWSRSVRQGAPLPPSDRRREKARTTDREREVKEARACSDGTWARRLAYIAPVCLLHTSIGCCHIRIRIRLLRSEKCLPLTAVASLSLLSLPVPFLLICVALSLLFFLHKRETSSRIFKANTFHGSYRIRKIYI